MYVSKALALFIDDRKIVGAYMEDKKILDLFRENKEGKAFEKLYKTFPKVRKFILAHGGSPAEASDVFQEALLIFCQKAKSPDFVLTASISTYLISVCRYIWKDELKRKNRYSGMDISSGLEFQAENTLDTQLEKERKLQEIEAVLLQIGKGCLRLLELFYFKKLRMKEIALRMGFRSEKIAKNQKYKCMERARLRMKESKISC